MYFICKNILLSNFFINIKNHFYLFFHRDSLGHSKKKIRQLFTNKRYLNPNYHHFPSMVSCHDIHRGRDFITMKGKKNNILYNYVKSKIKNNLITCITNATCLSMTEIIWIRRRAYFYFIRRRYNIFWTPSLILLYV